eukprot:CAMPEP_0202884810 /NCGR_PEP_ID=MMETSP1391-20130828/41340_1 /ASSEMBLY_ACC=CAM_ASM_000867 /TAXON_ID=1034604 /ORGANISM="Chlamydomonas leiostraca, Strain SAG 11-49" /LENGTH=484 /DNA_ID=CAMNT_0049568041 /DNA_START=96 /DNA_END=1550 /DNA_ORIENTATION=-
MASALKPRLHLRSRPVALSKRVPLVIRASAAPIEAPSSPLIGAKKQPLYNIVSLDEECIPTEDNDCQVFMGRDGNLVEVMCCDYGYRSGAGRMYQQADGEIPGSGFALGMQNFQEEFICLRRTFRYDEFASIAAVNPPQGVFGRALYAAGGAIVKGFAALDEALEGAGVLPKLAPEKPIESMVDPATNKSMDEISMDEVMSDCEAIRAKLRQLRLSNQAVWDREHTREATGGKVETPWYVKGVYLALCVMLDNLFNNRPIQRFWFLETVARMPYFSYIACLHLYESFGWWRAAAELRKIHFAEEWNELHHLQIMEFWRAGAELRKIHFAEEWNELHHLQIMESLGGDKLWVDRFMAYHAAIAYFWILVVLFIASPGLAYNFSELIEAHAVDTYGEFADANAPLLKTLPPPLVAAQYYRSSDLYMFDEFQTSKQAEPRDPPCGNLHDVFNNIRDDEGEHVKTMKACQDTSVQQEIAARRAAPRRI